MTTFQFIRKLLPLFRVIRNPVIVHTSDNLPCPAIIDEYGALWTHDTGAAPSAASVAASSFDLFSTPAAATQATATHAAAGAGNRNVLTSLTYHTNAVAAQAQQTVEVLDGAAVIWSSYFGAFALGASGDHTATFPNGLVGSVNTAMTIRFSAAPGAGNFNSIAGAGFIAGN